MNFRLKIEDFRLSRFSPSRRETPPPTPFPAPKSKIFNRKSSIEGLQSSIFNRKALWAVLLAVFVAVSTLAQQAAPQPAEPKVAPPFPVATPYPFSVGEKLAYEFSFSRFPLSGKLGELEISVTPAAPAEQLARKFAPEAKIAEDAPKLAFQAAAQSKGLLVSLFGVKLKNEYLSIADARDLGLMYSQKDVIDGKKHKQQFILFDRPAAKMALTDIDLAVSPKKVVAKTVDGRGWASNLLTCWYVLRTQPLTPGSTIPMVLNEDGQVYDVNVVVTQEVETIKTDAGKFKARKLDIKAYEAKFVRNPGNFYLWISEDAARIPVRVRFKTRGATVTGDLVKRTPGKVEKAEK
jgi:hypothetical protein